MGTMLNPTGLRTDRGEVTLLPDSNLDGERRQNHEPISHRRTRTLRQQDDRADPCPDGRLASRRSGTPASSLVREKAAGRYLTVNPVVKSCQLCCGGPIQTRCTRFVRRSRRSYPNRKLPGSPLVEHDPAVAPEVEKISVVGMGLGQTARPDLGSSKSGVN